MGGRDPASASSLFFFSSRRRHTRLTCDWSSDVCSSDLPRVAPVFTAEVSLRNQPAEVRVTFRRLSEKGHVGTVEQGRSEERRVGKSVELGGRWMIGKKEGSKGSTAWALYRGRQQRRTRL